MTKEMRIYYDYAANISYYQLLHDEESAICCRINCSYFFVRMSRVLRWSRDHKIKF